MGVTDNLWLYVLSVFLFLTVCFLLFQNFRLRKSASADDDYRRFLFEILDNLPFPIMVKDIQEQFKYTYWNKEAELQSGISRKDAVGFSDADIFGEERGKQYRKIDEDLVKAGKPYKAEERYVTADGKVHDTLVVKSIISSGKLGKWLLVARWEITQLKMYERELLAAKEQLEGAVRKQKLALRSIDFGLIYIDRNYKVQWEETSNIKNLVVGRHYIPGTTCYRTTGRGDKPCKRCAFQEAISTGKMVRHITHVDHVDFEITATPVYSDTGGEIIGGLLRFEDITEKLKVDRMLQEAKEKAEESNRLKSAFLANMSHEIRTPLNSINGFSEILSDDFSTPEEQKDYQLIIQENTRLLTSLLHSLVEVANLDSLTASLTLKPIEINHYCRLEMQYLEETEGKPEIDYQLNLPENDYKVYAHPQYLSLLLRALLNNANKFTTQGFINLSCRKDSRRKMLMVSVTDTGCGVPTDKHEYVFRRFTKLDTFRQGSGLGLYLCKLIIRHMQGDIYIDKTYTKGSRFIFTLPMENAKK